ncbi:xylose isomerase [Ramlibacter sp. AW1]|uniref:Xylose isomerase n=1 Tax=Ramlibacter aurantiacus TaxID=2801330 RepID=A0A937D4D5_9BURK|nr:xylose isomerase [Ramlibacter aurantiacus]MBL0421625.1 xylose isomerase [Ramlibacter aurantiacus]
MTFIAPTPIDTTRLPPIGCNGRGVQDSSIDRPVSLAEPSIEEQFRLVKRCGVFDHFDRLPLPDQVDTFQRCIEAYSLPVHTTSWFYELGTDDARMAQNLEISARVGATTHNMMIYARDASGRPVSDAEIVEGYLRCYDEGMRHGVEPTFELHVNMWSEDPRRIVPVAEAVRRRGVPFNFTLDYSHVIFKIGNDEELDISGIREAVASGRLVIDPFERGNLVEQWLAMGIVRWVQVRSVAPNGPRNIWAPHDPEKPVAALPKFPSKPVRAGDPGRGILYPFTRPAEGEWHSPWHAHALEPTKEVVRKVLAHHAGQPGSRLRYITTEMITLPDYALNARFSLIGQNAAIAAWVRQAWTQVRTTA